MDKKNLYLILEIRNRVRNRNRVCFNKECDQPAIISHLLQHNGILDHIAHKAHIIQLNSERYFDETNFRFQKRSIAKAEVLTYKGFCSKCDNRIFESIEKVIPDFNEYKTQLLFSYRAFLSEYRRILQGLDAYSEYLLCKDLNPQIKARCAPMKKSYDLVIACYKYYLQLFESDLEERGSTSFFSFLPTRRHFEFHTIEVPKIGVAASAIFSYAEDVPITKDEYNLKKPLNKKATSRLKPIFINIIPRENSTVIIIGYAKGTTRIEFMPVHKIDKITIKELFKLISDILIKRIDHWCTSISFFETMRKTGKDRKIIDLKHEYFIHPTSSLQLIKEMDLDLNLFEDI